MKADALKPHADCEFHIIFCLYSCYNLLVGDGENWVLKVGIPWCTALLPYSLPSDPMALRNVDAPTCRCDSAGASNAFGGGGGGAQSGSLHSSSVTSSFVSALVSVSAWRGNESVAGVDVVENSIMSLASRHSRSSPSIEANSRQSSALSTSRRSLTYLSEIFFKSSMPKIEEQ